MTIIVFFGPGNYKYGSVTGVEVSWDSGIIWSNILLPISSDNDHSGASKNIGQRNVLFNLQYDHSIQEMV